MKIKELYNLDSYKPINQYMDSYFNRIFKDAAYSGLVLNRNLEHVDPKIFEKKYPDITFMNSGITIDNTGGYVDIITSLRINGQGAFKRSNDESSDKGKISLYGEESGIKTLQKEAFSEWTNTDVRRAQLQNISLISSLIKKTNQIYMRDLDSIGLIGTEVNAGLLNHPEFDVISAAKKAKNSTPQEMYDEIAGLINKQWDGVSNTMEYMAGTVIFPTSIWNLYTSTMLDTAGSSSSVLTALRQNFSSITFISSFRGEEINGSSRTVAYSTSEDVMKFRLPKPLEVSEIVKITGTKQRMDYDYIVAGLDVLESAGAIILTGL